MLCAGAAFALALLTATPARSTPEDLAQELGQFAALIEPQPIPPATLSRSSQLSNAGRESVPFFFGFLEFYWNPNAPSGVPGFDPWPADGGTPR